MFLYRSVRQYIPDFDKEFYEITDNEKAFKELAEYIWRGQRNGRYGILGAFEHHFMTDALSPIRLAAKYDYYKTAFLARKAMILIAGAFSTEELEQSISNIDFEQMKKDIEEGNEEELGMKMSEEEAERYIEMIEEAERVAKDFLDYQDEHSNLNIDDLDIPEGMEENEAPNDGSKDVGPLMASGGGAGGSTRGTQSAMGPKGAGVGADGFLQLAKKGYSIFYALERSPSVSQAIDFFGSMEVSIMKREADEESNPNKSEPGYDRGSDLERLHPEEYAHMRNDPKRFAKRAVEGDLSLDRESRDRTTERGHLMIAVDRSGSMQGDPQAWAEGITGALVRAFQARRSGRKCFIVPFSTRAKVVEVTGSNFFEVLSEIQWVGGGGTDVENAIWTCIKKISNESMEDISDLLFITDALEQSISPNEVQAVGEKMEELGVSLYTAVLTTGREIGENERNILPTTSKRFLSANINTSEGKKNVEDMFARMITDTEDSDGSGSGRDRNSYWC